MTEPAADSQSAAATVDESGTIFSRLRSRLVTGVPHPQGAPPADAKPIIILLASTVFLTVLWYYGRLPFYREVVGPEYFEGAKPETFDLYGYFYLAGSSVVTRMLLPLVVIVLVFRQRPSEYGYRIRGTFGLFKIYLGLLAIMLPLLYIASGRPDFQAKYPLYDYAHTSLDVFIAYELSYVVVFLSGESFWRGFMVFGLARRFGLYALPIMAIPYSMIHFGKPFPEALGAILTGLVLGYLALKHRSFWLGVALHSTIGITMDLMCLWRKGQLGSLFGVG